MSVIVVDIYINASSGASIMFGAFHDNLSIQHAHACAINMIQLINGARDGRVVCPRCRNRA